MDTRDLGLTAVFTALYWVVNVVQMISIGNPTVSGPVQLRLADCLIALAALLGWPMRNRCFADRRDRGWILMDVSISFSTSCSWIPTHMGSHDNEHYHQQSHRRHSDRLWLAHHFKQTKHHRTSKVSRIKGCYRKLKPFRRTVHARVLCEM